LNRRTVSNAPLVATLAAVLLLIVPARASIFGDDIPGDGNLRCFPRSTCSLSPLVGTVTGQSSGSLQTNGISTLGLSLSNQPLFLMFSAGDPIFGPLGLDPAFNPTKISSVSHDASRDATIPIAGQKITFNVTNTGLAAISELDFLVPSPSTEVGITFGVFCTGTPDDSATCNAFPSSNRPLALLPVSSSPDSADLLQATSTFGLALHFRNLDILPNSQAAFTFYVTDYAPTLDPSTGGHDGGTPNSSFSLEVVPTAVATPEPGTFTLIGIGLAAMCFLISFGRRATRFPA
jgi:hypothetical protein